MYIDQIMVATNGERKVLIIVSTYHKKYMIAGEEQQDKIDYIEDVLNDKIVPDTQPAESFVVDEIDPEGNITGYAVMGDVMRRMSLYDGLIVTKVQNVPIKLEHHMVEFTVDIEEKSFDA